MQEGQVIQGFRLLRSRDLLEHKARLHELVHEKSGARLVWLERDEQNKTFSISFKTIPQDDSGVFHILEHCVLGGSRKYKVKEPFAELLKSSVNTFLNAMTFPDKTMYPVASRNEKDFLNLMEVYLDAVFSPSVLEKEEIFRQEGWAYAFDEEDRPSFQGVVYNEMKGASSALDRLADKELNRLLFPHSPYRFDSGGDPEKILDLTYPAFKEAHASFYHPSNAYIFLDGDLPLDRALELMDREYLSLYERLDLDPAIPLQTPVSGKGRHHYEIAEAEDPEQKCRLSLGRIVAGWEDLEKQMALAILCDALAGSNEAPLKKAILDKKLAQDFQLYLADGAAQAWIGMEAHNCREEDFPAIKETIRATLQALAEKGLNKADLLASLNLAQYKDLDPEEPRGVILAITVLGSWLYGGDPALYLEREALFNRLRDLIDTDYFDLLLQEFMLDRDGFVELESLPSKDYGRNRDAREEARLKAEVDLWTEEKRDAFLLKARNLEAWQASLDSPDALASLPSLKLEDLAQEPVYPIPQVLDKDGVTILSYPVTRPGLTYSKFYFDVTDSPFEDLPRISFLTRLLGRLASRNYEAESLQREIKSRIGRLHFALAPMAGEGEDRVCRLYFVVSSSALDKENARALDLVKEILTASLFDDDKRARDLMVQTRQRLRQAFDWSAHAFGLLRAKGHYTARDAAKEQASGLSYILWLKAFLADFDVAWPAYRAWAEDFLEKSFKRQRLTLSLTGEKSLEEAEEFLSGLSAGQASSMDRAAFKVTYPGREGVAIPSAVSYACLACDSAAYQGKFSGSWLALDQVLSLEYLWNRIRVQGGAYGAGFSIDRLAKCSFYSYRDPSPFKSLAAYRESGNFIRDFSEKVESIDRYIIGKLASLDPDLSFKQQLDRVDSWYLTDYSLDRLLEIRRQLMAAKPGDLAALADILDMAVQDGAVCLLGPRDLLDKEEGLPLVDIS